MLYTYRLVWHVSLLSMRQWPSEWVCNIPRSLTCQLTGTLLIAFVGTAAYERLQANCLLGALYFLLSVSCNLLSVRQWPKVSDAGRRFLKRIQIWSVAGAWIMNQEKNTIFCIQSFWLEYVRMDPGCLSVSVCVCVWWLYSLNGRADFDETSQK